MSWIVIVAVGVVFFGIQILVYRGTQRSISDRCGGWVGSCKLGKRSAQTREAAIADLERALAMTPAFGTLRRLGVIAPLLGVLLTAGSVLLSRQWSDLMQGTGEATGASPVMGGGVFQAMVPLFSGIFVGAFLAIFNQILVTLAHREEDRLFYMASDATIDCDFLRTDDRLAQIFSQIEVGGKQLFASSAAVESMLKTARHAMEGMYEACNAAVTDLNTIPPGIRAAIEEPVKDFVGAAREMRTGAQDAAKQFGTGIKTLSKQVEALEVQVVASLNRQTAATTNQVEMATSLAASARAFEAALAPLRSTTLKEFEQQVAGSAAAAMRATLALDGIERQCATAGEAFEQSTQKLSGAALTMSTTCVDSVRESSKQLSRSVRDAAQGIQENMKASAMSADQVRSAGEVISSLVGSMKSDGDAISDSLKSLSESIQKTAEEDGRLSSSLGHTTQALVETSIAIGIVRGALGQLDFTPVQSSTDKLARSVQSLDGDCSAASENMRKQGLVMTTLLAQLEEASARMRKESERNRLVQGTSAMSERSERDNGRDR